VYPEQSFESKQINKERYNTMKTRQRVIALAMAILPAVAMADFLGLSVGGGVWNTSPEGGFRRAGDPSLVDVKDNLLWDTESRGYVTASFEHFVPLLPNIRVNIMSLDNSGNGNSSFTFHGDTYTGVIDNKMTVEQSDLLLYWELLDNIVSLDFGIDARALNIDYSIRDNNGHSISDTASQVVPMLYLMVGASPWFGIQLSAEAYYISAAGNELSDYSAKISYTTDYLVGFEAGYRSEKIVLDDVDNFFANMTFKGPFLGAYLKF
jgi:outer membrane protein